MSGALLLALVTGFLAIDYVIAAWFIARANRAASDIGAAPRIDSEGEVDNPETLRRTAHLLMLTAPILWLVVAALAFGYIAVDGIVPVRLGAGS